MRCSIGVAAIAVLVLAASALTLVAAGASAYVFLGPMSSQLFDPAVLPPGADVAMWRATGLASAATLAAFGSVGVTTGVGLFRLWRWARYSMIAFGAFVTVMCLLTAFLALVVPLPAGPVPSRAALVIFALFYVAMALVGVALVFFFTRPAVTEQFGGSVDRWHPARPVAITVIAWLLVASGAMMLPSVAMLNLPATVVGVIIHGLWARLYYAAYMAAYLWIGSGLLRRWRDFVTPAIVLHAFAVLNAVVLLVPRVWDRYIAALTAMSPLVASQPLSAGAHWFTGGVGVALPLAALYFLVTSRDEPV